MSEKPRASDFLCPRWARVGPFDRYGDVVRNTHDEPTVFAVVGEDSRFMGLVGERQAALFPGRVFADLLVRRPPPPVAWDAGPEEVLAALEGAPTGYVPVVDGQGELLGVASRLYVFTALIGRLQAELEERRIAASVFDATSEGIMVTDAERRIVSVNRAFTVTTGYAREEVIGQTPRIMQSGRHDSAFYAGIWRALNETDSWAGEVWNRRKNGEIYPEWLHINAIRDEQGNIRHYVGVFSDITKHKELHAKLQHLTCHDALTDLPNRQIFMDRLHQTVAQARRRESGFSLLSIDLDGFKDVNDSLGHAVGDKVLVHAANRLGCCVRESDTVARIGGDEFVVILDHGHDEQLVAAAAERFLNLLAEPLQVEGHELFVTASLGISRYPEDGNTAEALLMAAETAMYRAKEDRKGTFRFHSAEMHETVMARVTLLAELRQALSAGELRLAWQPQVSFADGRVTGLEALARWTRKDGTPVDPAVFIPLAEQSDLIAALGDWVIQTACREAADLLAACPEGCALRFAVNLSPLQVRPTTLNGIVAALSATGLDPRHLEIELTENSLSTGREGMLDLLRSLGEAGVQVAVDDFGTGCSNIATIKLLPIHKLKLDRSFVMDLAADSSDREIAAAVIAMSHALGLEVVAEGVETGEQAEILTRAGCDHAQGYLYSRPQGKDEILRWLQERHSCSFTAT